DLRLARDGQPHLPGDPAARLCVADGPVPDRVRVRDRHEPAHRPRLHRRRSTHPLHSRVEGAAMRGAPSSRSRRRETFWARYRKHRGAVAGLAVVTALTAVALLAPALAPYDPFALGDMALSVPSLRHPMGTDHLGRDILSAGAWGVRVSLLVGICSAVISI